MKLSVTLFHISSSFLFLAWIAKMHFVFGGDILFRISSVGIMVSLLTQWVALRKDPDVKATGLSGFFAMNHAALMIVCLGMMMKVSHVMSSQFEKDFMLDFIGIPAIVTNIMVAFGNVGKCIGSDRKVKVMVLRHALFPWLLFALSFMLYAVYSVMLARMP
jgi:hypothetical protein